MGHGGKREGAGRGKLGDPDYQFDVLGNAGALLGYMPDARSRDELDDQRRRALLGAFAIYADGARSVPEVLQHVPELADAIMRERAP